ncbi:MAG: acyl-CoA thioesterase [Turneriella sp.]
MNQTSDEKLTKRHRTEIQVRWDEMDANQHVNNKVYQSYFDEARVQAMCEKGVNFAALRSRHIGPVITRTEIDYKHPLHHPDIAVVESWLENIGKFRSEFVQSLTRKSDGKVVCEARTFWTFMNLERMRPVALGEVLNAG